ncbi:MAG: SCO family protein, partial [Thermoanaerobaculia bacterium]
MKSTCAGLLGLSLLLAPASCRERQSSGAEKGSARIPTEGRVAMAGDAAAVPPAHGAAAPGDAPQPNRTVGVGDPVPDFALTDQTGRIVRLSEMRGEPVAVPFLYTQCPVATACPMTTAK